MGRLGGSFTTTRDFTQGNMGALTRSKWSLTTSFLSALIYEIRGITAATLAHRAVCISPPPITATSSSFLPPRRHYCLHYHCRFIISQHSVTLRRRRQAVKCTFSSSSVCLYARCSSGSDSVGPPCLPGVREWHQFRGHGGRRSMSDAGVTCRPNTTTGTLEEGRMIARSYRALFWTHTHKHYMQDRNIAREKPVCSLQKVIKNEKSITNA